MNNFPKIWLKSDSLVQFGLVYFSSVTYKKGPGSPGTFKKSPGTFGLLWSWDHGTTGPARSLGPVLSRPVLGPSRDIPGRDSPGANTNTNQIWKAKCCYLAILNVLPKLLPGPNLCFCLWKTQNILVMATGLSRPGKSREGPGTGQDRTGPRDLESPVVLWSRD